MIVGWLAVVVLGVSPVVWPPVGRPVGELTVKVIVGFKIWWAFGLVAVGCSV